MDAKDKAEELVEIYCELLNKHIFNGNYDIAKECALIAVDKIINNLVDLSEGIFTFIKDVEYWQDVKEEINKL